MSPLAKKRKTHGCRGCKERPGPLSCPYSPKCVEMEFCELRVYGVLRSSQPYCTRGCCSAGLCRHVHPQHVPQYQPEEAEQYASYDVETRCA